MLSVGTSERLFEALVRRLERYARRRPRAYRTRVALLAALGFFYFLFAFALLLILGLLVLAAAAYGGILAFYGSLPLLVLSGTVLRALHVKNPLPKGVALRRRDAPRLFDAINQIQRALQAPKPHSVVLTYEFNAGVSHHPRLYLPGLPKRCLNLGLPYLHALTPDQFRSVLAHEFGHFSRKQSRFASWIYRIEKSWSQLMEDLSQTKRRGDWILRRFFEWYAPLFRAYCFVLERAHEYDADRQAAEVTSARAKAEALLATAIRGRYVTTSFWPALWRKAEGQREPPEDVVSSACRALSGPIPQDEGAGLLLEALKEKTQYFDTHPSLAERLRALGYPLPAATIGDGEELSRFVSPLPKTAAQHLLGDGLGKWASELDRLWRKDTTPQWHDYHDRLQESRAKLRELEETAAARPLSAEETWQCASYKSQLEGLEAASPYIQQVLASEPDNPAANFLHGEILLNRQDSAGVGFVEKAMAADPFSVVPGCSLLSRFFARQGRAAEVREYKRRAEQQNKLLGLAQRERAATELTDEFGPHQIPDEQLVKLREVLSWFLNIAEVYLVRKPVRHLAQFPYYALVVFRRERWLESGSVEKNVELLQMLLPRITLPGENVVFVVRGQRRLRRRLSKIPGAEIYSRSRRKEGS